MHNNEWRISEIHLFPTASATAETKPDAHDQNV
jgi:hypothetical protein